MKKPKPLLPFKGVEEQPVPWKQALFEADTVEEVDAAIAMRDKAKKVPATLAEMSDADMTLPDLEEFLLNVERWPRALVDAHMAPLYREAFKARQTEELGESAGHPFRGNQWKGGEEGDKAEKEKTPKEEFDKGYKAYLSREDVQRFQQDLIDGKKVTLQDEHQASMLVAEMQKYALDCKERGEKAKDFNLCNITVPGTNLFCESNLGVERDLMPQFSGQAIPGTKADELPRDKDGEVNVVEQFRAALEEKGVSITEERVRATELMATQNELVGPKVAGMMNSMSNGTMKEGAIYVSREGYVLDGHHRWAATVGNDLKDTPPEQYTMPVMRIDMPIEQLLTFSQYWALDYGIAPKAGTQAGADGIVSSGVLTLDITFGD